MAFWVRFGTKIGAESCPNRIKWRRGPNDALLTLFFASLVLFGPCLVAILLPFWRLQPPIKLWFPCEFHRAGIILIPVL